FIYNTDIVPPGLVVAVEPRAGTPPAIAREILAPHGLTLLEVGIGSYAVVREEPRVRPPPVMAETDPGDALAEIVVATSRYGLAYDEPQPHTFLSQADVQALPKLADDPLRAVQRLPGSAAAGISAQTHIRGGEHNETLMVLDGLPLDEPFHLKNLLTPVTLFDVRAVESMDVYSGGFTAEFGGALSGVIDIATLQPPSRRYSELGLSLFHASALSAGEFAGERGQWLVSGRRSNLDLLAELADSDVGKPEYFDAISRVSFALTDTATIFATALTSRDEVDANTSDETEITEAKFRNTYVWGGWEQQWGGDLSSRLILALTDVDNDRAGRIDDPGRQAGRVDDRRTLRTGVVRLDLEHRGELIFTRLGFEGREVEARYRYSSSNILEPGYPLPGSGGETTLRDLDPRPDGHQTAVYLTSRIAIARRLNLEAGLRWDHQTYDEVNSPEQFAPRVNLMYDLTPATRLRAAWGRFWQAQRPNELQVEDGVDTFYEPQRADHLIISLEQRLPGDHELRVEVYRKDYDRVRPHFENLFDPVKLLPELEPDRVRVAPTGSLARGVEM
ncbi:MAG: TonB-dependent receptor, partial [Gammaproteobacteria bacterium]|nr:TonB-dependent receptor [Gammaproteobacteria bacterium]